MDLVRVQKKEQLYDREEVLGRQASSVFPTRAAEPDKAQAARELLGASNRFISESELAELRAQRGDTGADAAEAPLKPLTQVLAEAKQAHEDKFQAVWKSMKTGKNRPLDEDELEFVNELKERERSRGQQQARDEEEQLEAFRQSLESARDSKKQQPVSSAPVLGPQPPPKPPPAAQPKPRSNPRPMIKPVLRAAGAFSGNTGGQRGVSGSTGAATGTASSGGADALAADVRKRAVDSPAAAAGAVQVGLAGPSASAKRTKTEGVEDEEQAGGQGFALLGGYASSGDD